MSCFRGRMMEYPSLSIDCFVKENLSSRAYFLSHCHKDHMEGLDSEAFAKRLKSSKNALVYCSETTRNLLLWSPLYSHLQEYLIGIPVEQPYIVPLHSENKDPSEKEEVVTVTLLSAGHCVGSVMFLFEGCNGNVLYTGDFRLAKGDTARIDLLHSCGRVKDIKSVYVDTTFCLPKMMSIPSRASTLAAIIKVINRWFSRGPHHLVSLQCKGMYGYEYLLKEIALHYKTKIHISPERLELYQNLKDMTPHFTTDPKATRIHSCHWKRSASVRSIMPCGYVLSSGVAPNVLTIKPTTMWFARKPGPLPPDHTKYDKDKKIWRVVHSMHASMEEIRDLVGYLCPSHVYANVEPGGVYTTEDAENWLKDLTRGDRSAHVQSALDDEIDTSSLHRKPIVRSVPSESVITTCKELGLEDDVTSAPLPAKRRKKLRETNRTTETTIPQEETEEVVKTVLAPRPKDHEDNFENGEVLDIGTSLRSEICKKREMEENRFLVTDNSNTMGDTVLRSETFQKRENRIIIPVSNSDRNATQTISNSSSGAAKKCSSDTLSGSSDFVVRTLDGDKLSTDLHCIDRSAGVDRSSGVEPFNVPASPGVIKPSKDALSKLYTRLENGETI